MEPEQPAAPVEEQVPEPEEVQAMRALLVKVSKMIDTGGIESISIYIQRRDGCYISTQTCGGNGRHEDAGRMMEFAMLRLGFVQQDVVEAMIERL